MSIKTLETKENDYQALYEMLEVRYGPALAQSIIDEIRKADDPAHIPDYMGVKMLSEVLESMQPDWAGFYGILKQSYQILYKRAMDAYEMPAYRPNRKQEPERMAA